MRTPHTSCRKGKRVRIILRDGTQVITKFIETVGHEIRTEDGKFNAGEIRAFSIYKKLAGDK
jgi:dephospho-CoA kinase